MFIVKTKSKQLPSYFPLSVAFSPRMPPTLTHTHDCTELVIVISGSGIHYSGGQSHYIKKGDVIIIYPGLFHSYPKTKNLTLLNILYSWRDICMPLQDLNKLAGYDVLIGSCEYHESALKWVPPFHLIEEEFIHIKTIAKLMIEEQTHIGYTGFRCAMLGLFMNLLCHILRSYSDGLKLHTGGGSNDNIGAAIKYLDEHSLDPFNLKMLLKISAMSRSNFMFNFKNITGSSPMQYLIRRRISYAIHLIMKKKMSFSEIAFKCGFCSSSHFTKAFKQITNETPSNFAHRLNRGSYEENIWSPVRIANPFISNKLETFQGAEERNRSDHEGQEK